MKCEQLELNLFDESDLDFKMGTMQRQIDYISDGFGKVSRKVFYQIAEMNKVCQSIQKENIELKEKLRMLTNEPIDCTYEKESYLLDVPKY